MRCYVLPTGTPLRLAGNIHRLLKIVQFLNLLQRESLVTALHNTSMMQCPKCKSTHLVKNGWRNNQQNYLCRNCGRQLRDPYASKGYAQEVKQHCLTLYVNGVGFRGIERATGVNHNTVINGVKKAQHLSPDENHEIPQTAQVDELQTFVGSKKPKSGLGWHSTRNPLE